MTSISSTTKGDHSDHLTQSPEASVRPTMWTLLFKNTAVFPVAISVTIALAAFANPIQPVTDSRVSATNPILLGKLSVAGLAWLIGAWGVLKSPRVRALFRTLPGITLACLAGLFLLTSVFASEESALIGRAAALIFAGYLMFVATAVATLGISKVVKMFLLGVTAYLLVAWGAYLLFPEFGQFYEFTDATTTVARMGGLAHPNSIAGEAAVALVVCLAMIRDTPNSSRFTRLGWTVLIVLIVATLAATISRTSVIAAAAGVAMLMFDRLYSRRGVLAIAAASIVVMGGFFSITLMSRDSVSDTAVAAVTKSDSVEELTSLTGRTRIWGEAISLIVERPLTGYGLDSAASVMSKESVGTHNLLLHVVFSAGVVSGVVMLVLLTVTMFFAITSRQPLFRGIATFVLVSGLVEDTLFASFPCQITLLWMVMLFSTSLSDPVARGGH